jgi:hypothetical protein
VRVLTEEERAARLERWKAAWATRPKYKTHMFSCTVHDGKYTRVLWSHKGERYSAWSKLDWNDFAGAEKPDRKTRHPAS